MKPLLTKPYRVTTNIRVLHVLATGFAAAMAQAKDLCPGETILSVLYDPNWDMEVGA